ncbi:hypothetical protein DYB25_007044 [Aphanomyces astaci]|uniref:ADP-ribosylation factor-like protein 6 n=1 Tax=Aphanomyces astaci TaxID=112090 RepID=A0A397A4D3_APHAT|nr:hypothetical protein DYB25_007044 [Aphanomyces astaci]
MAGDVPCHWYFRGSFHNIQRDNMGLFKKLANSLGMKKQSVRILVVGLDNSGKTTLVNHLKPKKLQSHEVAPTVGFQVEEFTKYNLSFTVFDMSGQAIIFVMDSTDTIRMCVAKMDLAHSLTPVECMGHLELDKLTNKTWHITASNAISGHGVEEGIQWLPDQLGKAKSRK